MEPILNVTSSASNESEDESSPACECACHKLTLDNYEHELFRCLVTTSGIYYKYLGADPNITEYVDVRDAIAKFTTICHQKRDQIASRAEALNLS